MKALFCIVALLLFLEACKSHESDIRFDRVVFIGTADKVFNGRQIVLQGSLDQADTAQIVNGRFRFDLPFKQPMRYKLINVNKTGDNDANSICGILIAKPGEISIKANVAKLEESVISGAPDNDLYQAFLKSEKQTSQQIDRKLIDRYGKDYIKHFEPGDALYNSAMAFYDKLASAVTANSFNFIQLYPNSFAAVYVLQTKINELNPDTLEKLYDKLGDRYKKTAAGVSVANKVQAERRTHIGNIAPDFIQPDTSGRAVKLSSFRGNYVLVDFWASWCGPCREENPNLVKIYRKYHPKGFIVLGISLDRKEDKSKWLDAIHHDKLKWIQLSDLRFLKNKAAMMYGITSIPQNILISPDGRIVAKGLMTDALDTKLRSYYR